MGVLFDMKPGWRTVILFIACMIYICIGAGIFSLLESHLEEVTKFDINKTLDEFMDKYPNVDVNDLLTVVHEISDAEERGVDAKELEDGKYVNRWDFVNSFYFCTSVITTIGFGHLSPSTTAGKAVFMIYAFFGVPLMFWFVIESSTLMKVYVLGAFQKIQDLFRCIHRNCYKRILSGIIMFLVAYISLLVIPASIISAIEGWSHTNSQYFCFVAITTIGFGDLIATESAELNGVILDLIYKLCITVYFFVGMIALTTVALILQDRRPGMESSAQQQMVTDSGTGNNNHVADQIENHVADQSEERGLDLHQSSVQVTFENSTDDKAGLVKF